MNAPGPGAAAAPAGDDDATVLHGGGGQPPAPPQPAAETGTRQVGRYLIKDQLGSGGMATVFRAHDPSIARDVAIKFLHPSLCEDEECRMRFLREARAAGGLSHPHIVVVHDVGEIDRRPYMAMELVDGESLSELLRQRRQLPPRQVAVIALQLAQALEYAHGRGVVHRDIKPGNIVLPRSGGGVKVADFGIAHMADAQGGSTQVGAVMGTPQYMSPEQTRGDKVDGRSDLFSVGIVMYQMLAGERPFRGDSLAAVAASIGNETPVPLSQANPGVPAALRRVVDRCLAKQPHRRWQSGKELAEALQKVIDEIDEAADEPNRPRMVPLRIKWAATMALVVAVVMGLTSAVITQRQYAALMGQVSDYGSSLARFIAEVTAPAALGEEWDAVDVAVQAMMKTGNFERIVVSDSSGVVRVSSQTVLVGKPFVALGTELVETDGHLARVVRYRIGTERMLGFESPILFQGKQAGLVALGIAEQPITRVARLSIGLMVVLALVTVVAVAVAMVFLANRFARPIRLVGESMAEIGKRRFDHRIHETRNDEFGLLYKAFDDMAGALQADAAVQPAAAPAPAPAPPPVTSAS